MIKEFAEPIGTVTIKYKEIEGHSESKTATVYKYQYDQEVNGYGVNGYVVTDYNDMPERQFKRSCYPTKNIAMSAWIDNILKGRENTCQIKHGGRAAIKHAFTGLRLSRDLLLAIEDTLGIEDRQ